VKLLPQDLAVEDRSVHLSLFKGGNAAQNGCDLVRLPLRPKPPVAGE
jgi:hypothetical protein